MLEAALAGEDLGLAQAVALQGARGRDLRALCLAADHLRAEQVGDRVTYVVNRNINFTNVCVKSCRFCAFSRTRASEEGYLLPIEEVVRRAVEARDLGATEVCVQAGMPPSMDGWLYVDLCRAIVRAAPGLHVHGFSPEEIKYGAGRAGVSHREYLQALVEAGLGSLPGTSAEILDDRVRARLAPGRIKTAEWIEIIAAAHDLGLPTSSTMMFGHVESAADRARHLLRLRALQRETGGITEFVPLSFVHEEAPLFVKARAPGVRRGPTGDDVLRLYATARLVLGRDIPNLQASWVKEGLRQAQRLLRCGVNDLGGTLINESISTSAGARHGQLVTPATLRALIRDAGRLPAQRDTRYRTLRAFGASYEAGEEAGEALNDVADADGRFGSYAALATDSRWRFRRPAT